MDERTLFEVCKILGCKTIEIPLSYISELNKIKISSSIGFVTAIPEPEIIKIPEYCKENISLFSNLTSGIKKKYYPEALVVYFIINELDYENSLLLYDENIFLGKKIYEEIKSRIKNFKPVNYKVEYLKKGI